MNKKKMKGFTLVEVIVVMIIVGVLAAAAVPIYSQYVNDSRLNAASNAASSIAQYLTACALDAGTFALTQATAAADGSLTCTTNASTIAIPAGFNAAITGISSGTVTVSSIATPIQSSNALQW